MIGAFQGIEGAHSQLALEAFFRSRGVELHTSGQASFRAVAVAVSGGRADVGIVPVDNVISGTVREGLDLLHEFRLRPLTEIVWRMDHRLLGVPGATLDDVREILAHPLVLAECGKFIASLPHARAIPCEDTGIAAREVSRSGNRALAAIAPPAAAPLYALVELAARIADHPDNITRFVMFSSAGAPSAVLALGEGGPRKTSMILVTSNAPGSLARALQPLARAEIGISKIESKPIIARPDVAEFYVDLIGSDHEHVALDELKNVSIELRVLGSYRADVRLEQPAVLEELDLARFAPKGQPPLVQRAQAPRTARKSVIPKVERDANSNGTRLRVGSVEIGDGSFTIIAGPCSVESREQVLATAVAVRDAGARMLRGGAFKPRTNPYAFQGMGWEGVSLLAEAGRATGLPTVSEVMSIEQVERMALAIDVLQIGARNMQNFDLLKAVGRSGKPVLLKRGLSATIDELLAAAEYILAEGNPHVALCERGIRTFETATRNTLDLSAVPVLRERTHLPVIVDPSHGVGVGRWIPALCRAAKAVGAHGIIVEVHPNPPEALSDREQALTFEQFADVVEELGRIPSFSSAVEGATAPA